MKKIFPYILLVTLTSASELSHTLTNQGYTGFINTPSATVMNEGDITLHINNQFDNSLNGYSYNQDHANQEDYIVGFGLFPFFEIQGRLSEAPGFHRDLSANMKIQLPYTHKYFPNVAIGAQDLGSAANQYGNYYAVMDKEFWFVRASLGYGHSTVDNEEKSRMDGLFGALEVRTFDWLYLLAEDDTQEQFAGVRVHMPKSWTSWFEATTLISTNITNDYETSINLNITFPLYENIDSYSAHSTNKYVQEVAKLNEENRSSDILPVVEIEEKKDIPIEVKNITLLEIKKSLVDLGIENISIASKNDQVYIGYENGTFLFNDLDAMGIIIGLLTQTHYVKFAIEQKRSQTTVFTLIGDLDKAKSFYATPNLETKTAFTSSLKKISRLDLSKYTIVVKNQNSTLFKPKLEFTPKLRTFIGNEFGVFNYMLSLQTKLQVNIFEGIDISAVANIHIYDSEIDDHRYDWFMKLYSEGSYLNSVMIHSSNSVLGGVNTLSLGSFEENFLGVMDQYIYNIGDHTMQFKAGYFSQFQDGDPFKERQLGKILTRYLYMAKYSYLVEDYDTLFEINGGQYWNQDIGFDMQVKRFFGDIAVALVYQETTPFFSGTAFSEGTDRYAGVSIELPLTLRHTPNYKYGQVRGTNSFKHSIRTTIARKDGSNAIVPGGNYNPPVAIDSENYFYNRNRLQLSYFKTHAFRFVESYEKYVK